MKQCFVFIAAVLVIVCLPAPALCESSFNIINTPESDSSDQGSSLRDNQQLKEQESSFRDNQQLKEQESSFRDNQQLKEQESSFRDNQQLREQESIFRDNEELKEDSAVEFNEGLGDSVDYNEDL